MGERRKPLAQVVGLVWSVVVSMTKHDIWSLAATISFYALFAMFPLLLLIIYGSTLLVPHANIERLVLEALRPYYPAVPKAKEFITENVSALASVGAKVGLISGVGLFWSATSGFIAVQQAMDVIWEVHEQRSFLSRRLVAFSMLILMLALALVSSIVMAVVPWLTHYIPFSSGFHRWTPLLYSASRVLFPITIFITCYIFYRFLPSRTMESIPSVIGAFIAALGLDFARFIFAWYAGHLASYYLLYGGLAIFMLLILWMYIASIVMLFGAEVAAGIRMTWRSDSTH